MPTIPLISILGLLVLGTAATARAQGTLFPVSHAQTEGLSDYAHVGVTGSLADLTTQDGRNLNSAWLESGFPVEMLETFTFEDRNHPTDPILEYRVTALLFMDGIDRFPLPTPIAPPTSFDGSEERYLYRARFEVLDAGGTWSPAVHTVGGNPRGANVFDPNYPHLPPHRGTLRWDNGPSTPQWNENHLWTLPLGSGHPGEIVATGYVSQSAFQATANGFQVSARFLKSAQVASGGHDITHRWDDLSIAFRPAGTQVPFQRFGRLVDHLAEERVDPRLEISDPPPGTPPASRFLTVATEGNPSDADVRDGICIAGRWLDSQGSVGQRALRIADEFEFDALPFDITSGTQLESLTFRAIFYKHGDHPLAPNRAGDPPITFTDPSEEETIDVARVELLDWIHGTWTPLASSWMPATGYVPSSGAPWRDAGLGSYPELLSNPGTYPGGIDFRARALSFPFAPGHVSSAGRLRLRIYQQYTQDDMDGGWDITHSFDTVQLHLSFGNACAPSNQLLPELLTRSTTLVGTPFRLEVRGGASSSPLVYVIASGRYGSPIDLAGLGFPGCFAYLPPELTLPALLDANGTHTLDLGPLPGQSFLIGRPIYAQAFGIQGGAELFTTNPLGFWIR